MIRARFSLSPSQAKKTNLVLFVGDMTGSYWWGGQDVMNCKIVTR